MKARNPPTLKECFEQGRSNGPLGRLDRAECRVHYEMIGAIYQVEIARGLKKLGLTATAKKLTKEKKK